MDAVSSHVTMQGFPSTLPWHYAAGAWDLIDLTSVCASVHELFSHTPHRHAHIDFRLLYSFERIVQNPKSNPATNIMSNLIDADAGTERFGGYEAELKLVQADLNQQLEQIKETTGEPRKAAISRAERLLEEADELVSDA